MFVVGWRSLFFENATIHQWSVLNDDKAAEIYTNIWGCKLKAILVLKQKRRISNRAILGDWPKKPTLDYYRFSLPSTKKMIHSKVNFFWLRQIKFFPSWYLFIFCLFDLKIKKRNSAKSAKDVYNLLAMHKFIVIQRSWHDIILIKMVVLLYSFVEFIKFSLFLH